MFQSTHSVWSATSSKIVVIVHLWVSIHALRVECDRMAAPSRRDRAGFQSTHSVWSATHMVNLPSSIRHVSIHALRVECDTLLTGGKDPETVSIHALRVECDPGTLPAQLDHHSFNPRTPCGVRQVAFFPRWRGIEFQSTHSVWSATSHFSRYRPLLHVSIHALRVECDRV